MPKLNQILAIEKGKKTQLHQELSQIHHATQRAQIMNGHRKVFVPKEDDGETFPPEDYKVQLRHEDAINLVTDRMRTLMDITATKDYANCHARADVVVDGEPFLENAPVTFLLFLEKELRDLATFVLNMVELDGGETWEADPNLGLYRSAPVETQRTKKLQRPIVLYNATDKHPAQTQLITEDIPIGKWITTKFSGAIPRPKKREILERIHKLEDAVKFAREHANGREADEIKVGDKVLGYIFP